ncbi:MAG TPA: ROK family protein [Geodermatophilus sp.]|nr:ROK family protein [Geodermatophilus sp.]
MRVERAAVPATAGTVLQLIRTGAASTRSEVGRITGLSRSAVTLRLEQLMSRGLVVERSFAPSTGGRPPSRLELNPDGVVLIASLGATRARVAVCDLTGAVVLDSRADLVVGEGPELVVPALLDRFEELLEKCGRDREHVLGLGVSVPGTVEFAAGRIIRPPIMPTWDEVVLAPLVQGRFPVPVLVDNDVNAMALGEHSAVYRGEVDDLLFVKVSTGIGAGIIAGGRLQRGALGAAGDLGHIPVHDGAGARCHCGLEGCLEALAGGPALMAQMQAAGLPASHLLDVVDLVRAGRPEAVRAVREAGRRIGEVLAGAVNLLNPAVIVLGGDLARADEQLLPGIREVVYQRSNALATRELRIVASPLGGRGSILGSAVMVLDEVLSPAAVDGTPSPGRPADR